MGQPWLNTWWALPLAFIPSFANLGLTLHAASGSKAWNMSNVNATDSSSGYNNASNEKTICSVLSYCGESVASFVRRSNVRKALLSFLLQFQVQDNFLHKEELMGLRGKWIQFCASPQLVCFISFC